MWNAVPNAESVALAFSDDGMHLAVGQPFPREKVGGIARVFSFVFPALSQRQSLFRLSSR